MGRADSLVPKAPEVPKQDFLESTEVMGYMLDGTFPRTLKANFEDEFEYIPLTLAEEMELKTPETRCIRMLAKALKHHLDNGYRTPAELLIDINQSPEWNARSLLDCLAVHQREAVIVAIQLDMHERSDKIAKLFDEYSEEYESNVSGRKRQRNPLDTFVSIANIFKESSYKLNDFANMTALQYQVYTLAKIESSVRGSNDQDAMSSGTSPPVKGKSRKPTVGG